MKKFYLICISFLLFLSGCSGQDNSNSSTVYESESINTNKDFSVDYLDQVAAIEIDDVVEGKYKESIRCNLTREEVEGLKEIKDSLELSDITEKELSYQYKLNLYDKDGNLITYWEVVNFYYIIDGNGQFINNDGELEAWIEGVEESRDLITEIYDRTPGENYFSELCNISKGNGQEVVDHYDGVEYISFDLDGEDIQSLNSLCESIGVIEEPKEKIKYRDDLYYTMDVYTDTGEYYEFYISNDGTVYIQLKQTYQVVGDDVYAWFRGIEEKYGL